MESLVKRGVARIDDVTIDDRKVYLPVQAATSDERTSHPNPADQPDSNTKE